MLPSRLLTFAALVAAHAAASFVTLFGAYQTGVPEMLFWVMFIPWHMLGQTREGRRSYHWGGIRLRPAYS